MCNAATETHVTQICRTEGTLLFAGTERPVVRSTSIPRGSRACLYEFPSSPPHRARVCRVRVHITGFVVDTDFTSGDVLQREDARMRLIQYISGEMQNRRESRKGRRVEGRGKRGSMARAGGHKVAFY